MKPFKRIIGVDISLAFSEAATNDRKHHPLKFQCACPIAVPVHIPSRFFVRFSFGSVGCNSCDKRTLQIKRVLALSGVIHG